MGGLDHLRVDGVRLEARWLGPAPEAAPTIVLLHEGLGSVSMWKDFPERLAEATGYGVLVYSRQGYGASDPVSLPRPLEYMHTEALDVLPRVLDEAGIRQCFLLGHSDGASIALINAGGVPDPRVIGLVVMAPHVLTESFSLESIARAREAFVQGGLRKGLERHHGSNVDGAFWGWNGAWLDPGFGDWNIEEYLPHIAQPVLQIQGHDDEYGTDVHFRSIERHVSGPVTSLWLQGCGHSPHRDQPEATVAAIRDFLPGLETLDSHRRAPVRGARGNTE